MKSVYLVLYWNCKVLHKHMEALPVYAIVCYRIQMRIINRQLNNVHNIGLKPLNLEFSHELGSLKDKAWAAKFFRNY